MLEGVLLQTGDRYAFGEKKPLRFIFFMWNAVFELLGEIAIQITT